MMRKIKCTEKGEMSFEVHLWDAVPGEIFFLFRDLLWFSLTIRARANEVS